MSEHAPALGYEAAQTDADYDVILAVLMQTARGRWFLQEYARRHRDSSGSLLAAIGRIDSVMTKHGSFTGGEPDIDPAKLSALHARLVAVLDSLIECGAPRFLCNELALHLKTLAALCEGANKDAPLGASLPTPSAAATPENDLSTRDPFMDIRALSPEEKIALFT